MFPSAVEKCEVGVARLIIAPMKSELGPPMTLGNAARAELRLIVWCRGCGYQVDPGQRAQQHGADTPVLD
jgi:hypothetical protein